MHIIPPSKKGKLLASFVIFVIFVIYASTQSLFFEVYTHAPVNLCHIYFGSSFHEDYWSNTRSDCFSERAIDKQEPTSCLYVYRPGSCLGHVSKLKNIDYKTNNYCYMARNQSEKFDCEVVIVNN